MPIQRGSSLLASLGAPRAGVGVLGVAAVAEQRSGGRAGRGLLGGCAAPARHKAGRGQRARGISAVGRGAMGHRVHLLVPSGLLYHPTAR